MVPEISDESIEAFVSFTSASRDQAIAFLQSNNGDSNRAINAYFENPNEFTQPVKASVAVDYLDPRSYRSFDIDCIDNAGFGPAPSRPPSRVGAMRETKQTEGGPSQGMELLGEPGFAEHVDGYRLEDREAQEMQHAMAASLEQRGLATGPQESGVVSSEGAKFGPASREHYDTHSWALTLHAATSREISLDPDPELRRRVGGTPAFLRPSIEGDYLPSFLTILHAIPIAREELLWRGREMSDYGFDSQWWNGQPVLNASSRRQTTEADDEQTQTTETPLEDTIHETQRLMALLDGTKRAFGSADVLSNMKSLQCWRPNDRITTYFKIWEEISPPAADDDPEVDGVPTAQRTFFSRGIKHSHSLDDESADQTFSILDLAVDANMVGRTLYELLDGHIWCDMPDKELDDVWLEEVAPVFTMRIANHNQSQHAGGSRGVDVKIPAVWYPDRYMEHCKGFAAELRMRRIVVDGELEKLGGLVNRFRAPGGSVTVDTIVQQVLEGAQVVLGDRYVTEDAKPPSTSPEDVAGLIEQLRTLTEAISGKIAELEERKRQAIESLRELSNRFTGEDEGDEDEKARHRYTLRGVCTQSHVLYLLRPAQEEQQPLDLMTDDVEQAEEQAAWQWWRISFSVSDAKMSSTATTLKPLVAPSQPVRTSRATVADNVDVIGYTARKVREVEVLHAAREESSTVLLVYASDEGVNYSGVELPQPLKAFVETDNELFERECQAFAEELARDVVMDEPPELVTDVDLLGPDQEGQTEQTGQIDVNAEQTEQTDQQSGQTEEPREAEDKMEP